MAEEKTKYADLISKTQSEIDEERKELFVEESKQNIQGSILETKKEIASVKRELLSAKSEMPIDPEKVIRVKVKLDALNNGLKELEILNTELF